MWTTSCMKQSLLLLTLFTLLLGCDDGQSLSSSMPTLNAEELAEAKVAFEGTFALQVTTTTEQEIPVVGLTRSSSTAKKLFTVREVNGQFLTEETFCEIKMDTEGPAAPAVPADLVTHIPTVTSELYVEKQESQWQWERIKSGTILGARLDQPLTDLLPESADEDSVWDQDMDGQPGVTLTVSGLIEGEIYTVIRYVDTLSGYVDGEQWVGHTQDETEQVIVGASQEVLLLNVTPQVVDDPALNTVQVYRLDEGADCTTVLDRLNQGDD